MVEELENQSGWVWLPHPAHLCIANSCRFRLATKVGNYIVSTVGEWYKNNSYEKIGGGRLYETMVFAALPSVCEACRWEIDSTEELDFAGYNSAAAALLGHLGMCKKWERRFRWLKAT